MICRYCGQQMTDGMDTCAHCGKVLNTDFQTGANPIRVRQLAWERESRTDRRNLVVMFIVLVVLAFFSAIVFHELRKNNSLEKAVRNERIDVPGYSYFNLGELLDDICPDADWDFERTYRYAGYLRISGETRFTGTWLEITFSVRTPTTAMDKVTGNENDIRLKKISYGSEEYSPKDKTTCGYFLKKILDNELKGGTE